jgi:cytochrome d ubiquinol oxidase subunit I
VPRGAPNSARIGVDVTDLYFARAQMGLSLAFHIVFAAVGIGLPLLMTLAEWRARRTGDAEYMKLARTWAKGTAILFAVGAVSGTVLSFELGLLFPGFMRRAGAVIGMPFSFEGIAFFTEAVFLGIYLYGWDRLSPRLHLAAGVAVCVSGLASAVFVTLANAWMNTPRGFRVDDAGNYVDIDVWAAMTSPAAAHEVVHMGLAAYMATALAAAGIHAWAIVRARRRRITPPTLHRKALGLALLVAIPASLAQPIVGHWAGQVVAEQQPMKLAAMEQLHTTQRRAPLTVGPLEIPGLLSFMAFSDVDAEVKGLDEVAPADRPHPVVKVAFQAMVGMGTLCAAMAVLALLVRWRRRAWDASPLLLRLLLVTAPLGFLALEAGWIVTEVGRQPWVIYGVLRTADAVTPMPGLVAPFVTFMVVYAGLAATVIVMLARQVRSTLPEAAR